MINLQGIGNISYKLHKKGWLKLGRYLVKRVFYLVLTLLLIATFSFFLMKLLPGSPLTMEEKLSDQQKTIILEKYHLNDPIPVQYAQYLKNLSKGDLGVSFQFDNRSVTTIILERIGPSAHLGFQAMFVGTLIGLLLGIMAAIYHNSALDYSSTIVAVLGQSIPAFVFAGIMQYVLGVHFGWLPVAFWEGFEYTIMPTIALAVTPLAVTARFMRTEMLESLGSDYITTARAKGLSKTVVVYKHALRNSLIPIITIIGPLAVGLMTGSLVIENIFAIPGLGDQFVQSVVTNDFPVIMGTTIFFSFFFILIILVVDIMYGLVDPRIRLHSS